MSYYYFDVEFSANAGTGPPPVLGGGTPLNGYPYGYVSGYGKPCDGYNCGGSCQIAVASFGNNAQCFKVQGGKSYCFGNKQCLVEGASGKSYCGCT